MPRRDDFDDADAARGDYRDNYPPPRPRKSRNLALIIGLVVGGAALLGLFVCGLLVALFSMRSVHQPVPAVAVVADREAKKTYMRDEFRKLVIGKTKDEILALLGRPDYTFPSTGNWEYRGIVRDPISGKIDGSTRISFRSEVAANTN